VESAARLRPGRRVFVLFSTANVTDVLQSDTLNSLINFGNVKLRYVDPAEYLRRNNFTLDFLFKSRNNKRDVIAQMLTYVFLDVFGGIVLSLDDLLLKPISSLGQFVASYEEEKLAAYPITLDAKSSFLGLLLEGISEAEEGDDLGGRLMKRTLLYRMCNVASMKELQYADCPGAPRVARPEAFCPIGEDQYWSLLDPYRLKLVTRTLAEEGSYGVKTWPEWQPDEGNWGSAKFVTPFYALAAEKCPLLTRFAVGSDGHF